jgi:hypothetical protein
VVKLPDLDWEREGVPDLVRALDADHVDPGVPAATGWKVREVATVTVRVPVGKTDPVREIEGDTLCVDGLVPAMEGRVEGVAFSEGTCEDVDCLVPAMEGKVVGVDLKLYWERLGDVVEVLQSVPVSEESTPPILRAALGVEMGVPGGTNL